MTAHRGCIFKLMGDGILAEFGSVVDAVECAVDIQRGMAERNAGEPEDQPHRHSHRNQPWRSDRGGSGPAWRGRQHRRPPPAACRSGRHLRFRQGGEGGGKEARVRLRADGRAEGQEHQRTDPGLSGEGSMAEAFRHGARTSSPPSSWAMPIAAAIVLVIGAAAAAWYGFMRSPTSHWRHPCAVDCSPAFR